MFWKRPPGPESEKPEAVQPLECRNCGCRHFYLISSRVGWGRTILRRKQCRHCGRQVTTSEKPPGE